MSITVFLLALAAHLGADFLLQSEALLRARSMGGIVPYLLHGGILALSLVVLLHIFGVWNAVVFAVVSATLHAGVDWTKDRLRRRLGPSAGPGLFLADQGLHLFCLFFLAGRLDFQPVTRLGTFYRSLWVPPAMETTFIKAAGLGPALTDKFLLVLVFYLAVIFGGSVFVRELLEAVRVTPQETDTEGVTRRKTGLYIGLLERSLVLTLILADAASAVGLVVAAKSVARFKELNEKGFAEYYLVGTLASITLAVAGGVVAKICLAYL
ncbi:MAG: DUF3307 domain-containing protein [Firmicutes bacterium]|nr:DUF3307 domain-containing protein [Bacillota bacterium]